MRLLGYDLQFNDSPALQTRSGGSTVSDMTNPQEWFIRALSGMAQSATGITVTPLRALGVACVFACVRVLTETIATLPLEVRQRKGRRRKVVDNHLLSNVLRLKPNDEMTKVDCFKAIGCNLFMQGAGFAEILINSSGEPNGVYPVETGRVDFWRNPRTKQLEYRVMDTMSRVTPKLKPSEILHFKGMTFNGVNTLNTTASVRECIALALAMQDNAAKFFGNGSRPNGVLKHPLQLSKEAQNRLRDEFEENSAGQNLYRLMVLEEGLEYVATRSENKDSQFNESRDAQNLEICRIYGVPPHKVGIQNSQPRANIEEENIAFVMDRIRPVCVTLEQEMDYKLFNEREQAQGLCTYFDLDALMRGNMKARYEAYGAGRQWGILTANDCRTNEDLDSIDGGDVLLQPLNMADASKATEIQMKNKQQPDSEGGSGGKPNSGAK